MKPTLTGRLPKILPIMLLGICSYFLGHAQMKIGNNPTQIHPASILELESNNQALRLTQGDTAAVNNVITSIEGAANSHDTTIAAVKGAEGMIMYQNSNHSLYMRVGGYWRQVVSSVNVDSTFWKLGGNSVPDSAHGYLGTLNAQPLTIGMNNNGYIIIHSNGRVDMLGDSTYFKSNAGFGKSVTIADSLNVNNGSFKVSDSVYMGKPLAIHDSIVIKGLGEALNNDTSVLVLGSNGIVRKMSINALGIRSVNGVKGPYLHLKFDTISVGHTGPWIDSTTQAGSSALILNIPDASPTVRGLVNTGTQVFGGKKSFQNTLAVGTADTATSTLTVNGSVGMATKSIGSGDPTTYNMTTLTNAAYRTLIFDVTSVTGGFTVTLPDASKMDGRLYTFKKIGSTSDSQLGNPVKINTSSSQTIDGDGSNFTIYNNFTSVTLQAKGGEWYIIGH